MRLEPVHTPLGVIFDLVENDPGEAFVEVIDVEGVVVNSPGSGAEPPQPAAGDPGPPRASPFRDALRSAVARAMPVEAAVRRLATREPSAEQLARERRATETRDALAHAEATLMDLLDRYLQHTRNADESSLDSAEPSAEHRKSHDGVVNNGQ